MDVSGQLHTLESLKPWRGVIYPSPKRLNLQILRLTPFDSLCITRRICCSVVAVPCYAFVAARNRKYCLSLQTSQELNFKNLIKFVAPIFVLFLVTINLRKHIV